LLGKCSCDVTPIVASALAPYHLEPLFQDCQVLGLTGGVVARGH